MSKEQQKPLCPFKKITEREYSGHKGATTTRERFDVCAGERCMAYQTGTFNLGTCKRLEGGNG